MSKLYVPILLFISINSFAQEISIDFESNNLNLWSQSAENHWSVDNSTTLDGTGSLHHNYDSEVSAIDMISYEHQDLCLDSSYTEWQFSVLYDNNPSAGNNWAVWLCSSLNSIEMHPSGSSEGYILGVNYTGSDDIIKLWKQNSSSKTAIITSTIDWEDESLKNKQLDFKVTRSIDGNWAVSIDTNASGHIVIGAGTDNEILKSNHFGVYYEYTSSLDRKLWADDFYVSGTFYSDTLFPEIDSIMVESRDEIYVSFSEAIDTNKSITCLLNNSILPESVNWVNLKTVKLSFGEYFSENNTLSVTDATDLKGNVSPVIETEFNYHSANLHDVLITEIMADPTPSEDLPECEYIELHNYSDKTLNLKEWQFYSGNRSPIVLEEYIFTPHSYLVIADDGCASEFPIGTNIISISSMPTITNTGDLLKIYDRYNQLIHKVEFTSDWYENEYKNEGGWSLELIDKSYPCVFTNNWKESQSAKGGTPGIENSINGSLGDYPYSKLLSLTELTDTSCLLQFSESLDSISASNSTNYSFQDIEDIHFTAIVEPPVYKDISLQFSKNLSTNNVYTLNLSENIYDCSGKDVEFDPIVFGIPQSADSADLIINEILFENTDDIPEYVEIYNNSDKVIDIKGFLLIMIDTYADTIEETKVITYNNHQIFPKSFLVITENKQLLLDNFTHLTSRNVIQPKSWLELVNSGGKIALIQLDNSIVDEAIYSTDMHFALIDASSGVALERISPFHAGNIASSWHSAASSVNYATPGEENSQNKVNNNPEKLVSINPKEFSPDNDGYNDFLTLSYNFNQTGFIANIRIYSQNGTLVRHWINNELCGISGDLVWDGLDGEANRLAMGYYIIYFEAWSKDGQQFQEKLTVLLLPEKK